MSTWATLRAISRSSRNFAVLDGPLQIDAGGGDDADIRGAANELVLSLEFLVADDGSGVCAGGAWGDC